jgi:hypothetical protein
MWLLGRCCMQHAQLCRTAEQAIAAAAGLQPSTNSPSSSSSGGVGAVGGQAWAGSGVYHSYVALLNEQYGLWTELMPLLAELVTDVDLVAFMEVVGLSKRLGALGSGALAKYMGVLEGPHAHAGAELAVNALHQVAAVMEECGVFFSAFPHARACNNAVCFNLCGPSEQHLVRSHSCTCSGCRTARYCSAECQRHVWKQHKPVCKALGRVLQEAKRDRAEAVGAQGTR